MLIYLIFIVREKGKNDDLKLIFLQVVLIYGSIFMIVDCMFVEICNNFTTFINAIYEDKIKTKLKYKTLCLVNLCCKFII